MADFNALTALINAYIKQNGVKAITGQILNGVLRGMVSALGKGYTVAGEASPTTDPGTMTGPVAYIAHTAGTYEHFGNLVVAQGEVAMLIYDEAVWRKDVLLSLSANATVDSNVGTPEVTCTFVDGVLTFDFRNMKGNPGVDGDPAGFGSVTATVDANVGTPGVSVQTSGPDTAKNIAFQFTNLKGETGVTSCVVTVDNTTGTPSCAVSLVGQELHLDFSGLKGAQGNTGSSVDYPFTIVNNLTTDDATQALSAAQGVVLDGKVSQLEAKIDGGTRTVSVEIDKSDDGWRITSGTAQITNAAATGYSVCIFKMEYGKTYHLTIPKLTNAYTGAYGFFDKDTQYLTAYITKPSTVTTGPITNFEIDVTPPDSVNVYLVVCYETAYGVPTLTTSITTIGLVGRVDDIEDNLETLVGAVEGVSEDVADNTAEIERITTDSNVTIWENTGEWSALEEVNKSASWKGQGTYTPALAEEATINRIILPPFQSAYVAGDIQFAIYQRVFSLTSINTNTETPIAEGVIANVPVNSWTENYEISLPTPITVPAGNQIVVLLYNSSGARILGYGADATAELPYNDKMARGMFYDNVTTTPFSQVWSIASETGTQQYKVCTPVLKLFQESIVKETVNELAPEIVENYLAETEKVDVYLPNKIYAVVGDTLQLFYQGIVGVVNIADYDIYAVCSKGKSFSRYYEFTPQVADVGTHTLTVKVRNRKGVVLGSASCELVTVASPVSPATAKKIFCFGDSLTAEGQWPGEAKRRLVGVSTYDSIVGKGLNNLDFLGYLEKTINGQLVDYFGVGGWTWENYTQKAVGGAFRFFVSGVSQLSVGAVYSNNGHTYTVQEINITGDSGNIRCTTSANTNTPTASGTLTKTSGDGDATITFASYDTENGNPLWDDDNNKMSFVPYVQDCGASTVDAVFVLLSWNGQGAWKEYSVDDTTGHIPNAKTFARTLHAEYPGAKLFIMGIQMPSFNGGLGYNYGASENLVDEYGMKQCALNYNKALQDLCNDAEFNSYCEFIGVAPQFDSQYNMPYYNVNVNTRNSTDKEHRGANGVHPSNPGYMQIADTVYRAIVANFCQS